MGTTAKLAGRAMQTTHACNWATMKRKKKRKKKKPPKASEGKERQRSPGFTRKAQKYNKGSMYKTKRAESNSKVEMIVFLNECMIVWNAFLNANMCRM